ncbi:uncharacterized protein EI90DRAFT_2983713 [Cantharellus anzutake]|uniref:uncharacterized protein n=1 Tax=Cantharellus anzutake TaxID=1750568 RepID=UPI00190458AA|nr:uncharacterized protein EI90DRAFT_2983713 [Cantharellus anzutake]KAF8309965.1 hypothetical protein EI90DRAFT_2983713 [Cantharellus anzutake]
MSASNINKKKRKAPSGPHPTPTEVVEQGIAVPAKRRKVAPEGDPGSGPKTPLLHGRAKTVSRATTGNSKLGAKKQKNKVEKVDKGPKTPNRKPPVSEKQEANAPTSAKARPLSKIIKLTPNRPFPKVAPSESATGPLSNREKGKNHICVTRRVALGAYLRRCVELIKVDGYRTIIIHAMAAAIPHATLLSTSLPSMLSFKPSDIRTTVKTDTTECIDEILPSSVDPEVEDEDDEGETRTRRKSSLMIVLKIGDGVKVNIKPSGVKK